MKTNIKKRISLLLCVTLLGIFLFPSYSYGKEINISTNATIQPISSSKYMLSINDEKAIIEHSTQNNITKVYVTELTSDNNYYYIRDNNNNTIYSSVTDKTISLEEVTTSYEQINRAISSGKYLYTKTVSTSTIAKGVVKTATLVQIATFILTCINLVAAPVFGIVDTFTSLAINSVLSLHSKYKSVKLDVYEYIRSTTKNGKVYRYPVKDYKNVRLVKR